MVLVFQRQMDINFTFLRKNRNVWHKVVPSTLVNCSKLKNRANKQWFQSFSFLRMCVSQRLFLYFSSNCSDSCSPLIFPCSRLRNTDSSSISILPIRFRFVCTITSVRIMQAVFRFVRERSSTLCSCWRRRIVHALTFSHSKLGKIERTIPRSVQFNHFPNSQSSLATECALRYGR